MRRVEVPAFESDHVGRSGTGGKAPAEAHDPKLGALEALANLRRFPGLRNSRLDAAGKEAIKQVLLNASMGLLHVLCAS